MPQAGATAWGAVLFLAVVTSILGYLGWYWALDRGGIARIATLQFLQPVSGFVLAALVLGENVTVPIAVGQRADRGRDRDRPAGLSPTARLRRMAAIPDRVLVVGLARSGRAAVAALRARGTRTSSPTTPTPGADVVGIDGEIRLGDWDDAFLDGVGLVVKSPGVPDARRRRSPRRAPAGIPVISEIELGARLLANPILGVTGTNGKTTTTALLGAMFDAAGVPAEVAGNIGRPLTSLVGAGGPGRLGRLRALVASSSRTSTRCGRGSPCS